MTLRGIPCFILIAALAWTLVFSEEGDRKDRFCNTFQKILTVLQNVLILFMLQCRFLTSSSFPMTLVMQDRKMAHVTQSKY